MGSNTSDTKHNISKTVGTQTARLLTGLYDRQQSVFTLPDAQEITGLRSATASSLLHRAVGRGLFSRLKPGVFLIVPPELGSTGVYAGNPYLTAIRLAGEAACFISHGSAMEIHRMTTQPQLVIVVSSSKRIRSRKLLGTEFRFVLVKPKDHFGVGKHWVTKQEIVVVSDLERTILDGLRHPEYSGGVAEVAKGLWMRHEDIQMSKLVAYALRMGMGAVTRRLGYLLELYELASPRELEGLREALTATYAPLDPMLPDGGPHLKRWQLRLNVGAEELLTVRST